ncbi:5-methyltetrahydropteroyltriglutamate--homocysteine S-methyltransferase [Boudabousia liubingyangii]|uniref:5-methyltetrahydropteroyltriglutamate-- homocysteine S-methyltransferase n=1 Tax=Boudabousia liubingyangii TaxID=1921764 RepID=UPI00093E6ADE|nr:5-methyltetrahydropteroyltriglutamate--homocysteine S-methyltransferase [Boudabousia liubingyangii]OKL46784.1 5-methyltetrahydropteroyltriglutamate--homocysteine S-methyltransferase [Boudabousia liubingyangii]
MSTTSLPAATILGYPRIGANRELKRALEQYWAGKTTREDLVQAAAQVRAANRQRLNELGLTEAYTQPADHTLYDQVLSVIAHLGAVPARFRDLLDENGGLDLDGYFTLARGEGDRPALEMTKWFDSNYHYLVPEIGPDTPIDYVEYALADQFREALEQGVEARPVLVGPVTFLLLAKATDDAPEGFHPLDRLNDVLHAYGHWLMDLQNVGAKWVQLDEPALVSDSWDVPRERILKTVKDAYTWLGASVDRPQILVAGTYGNLGDALPVLGETDVEGVALDLVAGQVPAAEDLAALAGKSVVAGVVSGRNIWRTNMDEALATLRDLQAKLPQGTPVTVATSTSLQHVPHDKERETSLPQDLRSWLAFADQKVQEVQVLARGLAQGDEAIAAELAEDRAARESRQNHPGTRVAAVRETVAAVTEADRNRSAYEVRLAAQESLGLPLLPTTTIGSFPQTADIRKARAAYRKGELSEEQYAQAMRDEIAHVVKLQEELGLDVLVHGEAERNDMVQYFAELLEGFAATEHGWVQSYGSRCTRPSILWGDVTRPAPMTVEWSAYAQSLTEKPMKGMLTGPVTIMAWSFVRDDVPRKQVADQLGLVLRDEIADLEQAGIRVVQVDEPAIRELLPLQSKDRAEYLDWSVGSFRLATGQAQDGTQVHTHLCYSEFNVVVDAIDHLDADVTSIEASRSKMDILPAVAEHGFSRQLGPGIWDIHSPRVPSEEEQTALLQAAVDALPAKQVWVNPDCGLKTRGYAEVEPTLRNLVAAARNVRERLA